MNLKLLKEKAKKLKEQASIYRDKAIKYSSEKLASSSFAIDSKEELEKFILKSENTNFKNKETGEEKTFIKKVIIIFGEEKSDFFKEALYMFPSLVAKAFSQNISLKLSKSEIKGVKLSKYNIIDIPSLVVFENKKVFKVIGGRENILKLVKSLNLDINKEINKY